MAKILAKDYFEDSKLFDAEVLDGNGNKSATSSGVKYELTCKSCGEVTQRTGNSKVLNTCSKCKYVWDRERNEVRGPGWHPGFKEKSSAEIMRFVESDEEEPVVAVKVPPRRKVEEDNAPVSTPARRKITTDSIAQLLLGNAPAKPVVAPVAKPIKDDVYKVETILDYYDERLADSWHRYYYTQWVGYSEPTFVLDDDFIDKGLVKSFEASLPEVEQFKTMFPKTSRKNKTTKHAVRSKIDVFSEHGSEDTEVVETMAPPAFALPAPPAFALPPPLIPLPTLSEASCIEVKQSTFTHILLKKGQVYKIGDFIIEAI